MGIGVMYWCWIRPAAAAAACDAAAKDAAAVLATAGQLLQY
jgi:hypothetical protein